MKIYAQYYDNRPAECPFPGVRNWYVEQARVLLDCGTDLDSMERAARHHASHLSPRPSAFRIFRNHVSLTGIVTL